MGNSSTRREGHMIFQVALYGAWGASECIALIIREHLHHLFKDSVCLKRKRRAKIYIPKEKTYDLSHASVCSETVAPLVRRLRRGDGGESWNPLDSTGCIWSSSSLFGCLCGIEDIEELCKLWLGVVGFSKLEVAIWSEGFEASTACCKDELSLFGTAYSWILSFERTDWRKEVMLTVGKNHVCGNIVQRNFAEKKKLGQAASFTSRKQSRAFI